MNFRHRPFERAMKPRLRRAVKASPTLRKERQASKRARRRLASKWGWVLRVYLLMMLGGLVLQRTPSERLFAVLVGMWTLGILLHHALELPSILYAPQAVAVWGNLPVDDGRILANQMRRFVLKSLWTGFDFVVAYYLFMLARDVPGNLLWAVGCGLASWLFVTAGSIVVLAFVPMRGMRWVSTSLLLGTIVCVIFRSMPEGVLSALHPLVSWVPPLNALWPFALTGEWPKAWPALALDVLVLAVVIAVVRPAWRRIATMYTIEEGALVYAAYATGQSYVTADAEAAPGSEETQSDAVKSGDWIRGLAWHELGFVERLCSRFLTVRERVIAETLTGGSPDWTSRMRLALWLSGIAVAVALIVPKLLAAIPLIAFGLAGGILATTAGGWGAASTLSGPGLRPPIYACYPIQFSEVVRLQFKVNALRWCLLGPLAALVFELLARSAFSEYPWLGLKILLLWLAISPAFPIFTLSNTTNDTSLPGLVLACLIPLLVILVSGIFLFAIPEWQALLIAIPAIAVSSTTLTGLYGWYFNRSWIELCPKRLPES